jgi:hypothetical protein
MVIRSWLSTAMATGSSMTGPSCLEIIPRRRTPTIATGSARSPNKPENGGNGDGVIDSHDQIYKSLLLWTDENHDGLTQPGELQSLAARGVEAIELQYQEVRRQDRYGNDFKYRARIHKAQGQGMERWAYDVFLLTRP